MKPTSLLTLIGALFFTCLMSCADPPTYAPRATIASMPEGGSVGKERVVTFPEVHDETNGTAAEHAWTETQFPDYEWHSREVLEDGNGRTYHRVTLTDARGHRVKVYFDITAWFDRLR